MIIATHSSAAPAFSVARSQAQPPERDDGVDPVDQAAVAETPLKASSHSASRDGNLLLSLLVARGGSALPGQLSWAGPALGVGLGALSTLTGYLEVREGMGADDTREVLDGAAHMLIGGIIAAAGCSSSPFLAPGIVLGGMALVGGKILMDHPQEVAKTFFKETWGMARNIGTEAASGVRRWWHGPEASDPGAGGKEAAP